MKIYLYLAETGFSLSDLAVRIYEGINLVSAPSLTLTALSSATDYVLDGISSLLASSEGITVTLESPYGVYHAYRIGKAKEQPLSVIIPIRETFIDPISSLSICVFKNGIETIPDNSDVTRLASDGEYAVSGWPYTPKNEQWAVRWIYNGQTFAHQWTGVTETSGNFYQEIRAIQSPFPYRISTDNRQLFSCNFIARLISPTIHFEEDIEYLLKSGPGTPPITSNEVIYLGFKSTLPDGAGPFNIIIPTGGYESDESHDSKKENRGLQILTCAEDYEACRDRAEAVFHYLDGLRGVVVSLL